MNRQQVSCPLREGLPEMGGWEEGLGAGTGERSRALGGSPACHSGPGVCAWPVYSYLVLRGVLQPWKGVGAPCSSPRRALKPVSLRPDQ